MKNIMLHDEETWFTFCMLNYYMLLMLNCVQKLDCYNGACYCSDTLLYTPIYFLHYCLSPSHTHTHIFIITLWLQDSGNYSLSSVALLHALITLPVVMYPTSCIYF